MNFLKQNTQSKQNQKTETHPPEPIAFKCCFLGPDQDGWRQG